MTETKVEIITVGDEILYGHTVDTNSKWISAELGKKGFNVNRIISIKDEREIIISTLKESSQRAHLILITGGLGPTKDDKTTQALADFFQEELIFHTQVFENIKNLILPKKQNINELNRLQAYVPESAEIIHNSLGTAPGFWFNKENIIYIAMPGVPYEMKKMMNEQIFPRLHNTFDMFHTHHQIINTIGCPESELAQLLKEWEENLPNHIKLAYLPHYGQVKLRMTAIGMDLVQLKNDTILQMNSLRGIIKKYIYTFEDKKIEEIIGEILLKKYQTISIAESCTGGFLSHQITLNPGCSTYFKGSVVAYSNEIKKTILGIKEKSIKKYGAVSKEVAKEMAQNIKNKCQTDYGIATTGILGPCNNISQKAIGTVWIAISSKKDVYIKLLQLSLDRENSVYFIQQAAMDLLRKVLIA